MLRAMDQTMQWDEGECHDWSFCINKKRPTPPSKAYLS